MVQDFSRPTLTAEQKSRLAQAAKPLKVAREVYADLAAIGVDVAEDVAQLDNVEQVRGGLLERFSTKTPRRS